MRLIRSLCWFTKNRQLLPCHLVPNVNNLFMIIKMVDKHSNSPFQPSCLWKLTVQIWIGSVPKLYVCVFSPEHILQDESVYRSTLPMTKVDLTKVPKLGGETCSLKLASSALVTKHTYTCALEYMKWTSSFFISLADSCSEEQMLHKVPSLAKQGVRHKLHCQPQSLNPPTANCLYDCFQVGWRKTTCWTENTDDGWVKCIHSQDGTV